MVVCWGEPRRTAGATGRSQRAPPRRPWPSSNTAAPPAATQGARGLRSGSWRMAASQRTWSHASSTRPQGMRRTARASGLPQEDTSPTGAAPAVRAATCSQAAEHGHAGASGAWAGAHAGNVRHTLRAVSRRPSSPGWHPAARLHAQALVRVPRALMLTAERAAADPEYGPLVREGPLSEWQALLLALLCERARGDRGFFAPYLAVLPPQVRRCCKGGSGRQQCCPAPRKSDCWPCPAAAGRPPPGVGPRAPAVAPGLLHARHLDRAPAAGAPSRVGPLVLQLWWWPWVVSVLGQRPGVRVEQGPLWPRVARSGAGRLRGASGAGRQPAPHGHAVAAGQGERACVWLPRPHRVRCAAPRRFLWSPPCALMHAG